VLKNLSSIDKLLDVGWDGVTRFKLEECKEEPRELFLHYLEVLFAS
jgi:hypothetical protein